MDKTRITIALIAALLVTDALGYFGLFGWLGAHPFWDIKIAVIGSNIGILFGLAMWWAGRSGLLAGLILLGIAGGAATFGKARFVASYAEDAFAGKLWYFGWIGVAAGLSLLIFSVIASKRQ